MKKLFLVVLLLIPFNVFASDSFVVDNSKVTIKVGEKKVIKVTAKDSAGKLNISSSNSKIASVSKNTMFLDNDTETIELTGKDVGKTTVSIVATSNYATYDERILEGEKTNISVNVVSSGNGGLDDNPGTLNNGLWIIVFIILIIISSLYLVKNTKKETNMM